MSPRSRRWKRRGIRETAFFGNSRILVNPTLAIPGMIPIGKSALRLTMVDGFLKVSGQQR
jgi:hypothetical protein